MKNWFKDIKDNIAPILAILTVTLGFAYLFFGPDQDRAAVIALMMLAPTYYFGSSPGSTKKDELIAKMKLPQPEPCSPVETVEKEVQKM